MRVAFSLIGGDGWTGGSQYLVNLLKALHDASSDRIEPVMFASRSRASEVEPLEPYLAKTVYDDRFSPWSPAWFVRQAVRGAFDDDRVVGRLFRRHGVEAVFHAGLFGTGFSLPCVNWIADFQHLHMPEMFSRKERTMRDRLFRNLARMCRRLALSSECARKDFESFLPAYKERAVVFPFVAQIPETVYACDPIEKLRTYNIPGKFFHLPNQFWKHKNHKLVIDALGILKEKAGDIFVVCTGSEKDRRNPGHFVSLKKSVADFGLQANIALLGLVPIEHLHAFMRQSVAIMNPSLFEGWSTTVEEAKSLGKKVLLSDIPVHREQMPPGAVFFDPKDPRNLARKMMQLWEETPAGPDTAMEARARESIKGRIQTFVDRFVNIMKVATG
jgi:glycosyltransferase involved in cell wall biosynthesis